MSGESWLPEPISVATLQGVPVWVGWQQEVRPGETDPTKIPYVALGRKARANAKCWLIRDAAEALQKQLDKPFGMGGVGIEFTTMNDGRSIAGVDLDLCRDAHTGLIEDWALSIIKTFNSYTEVSPSGTGAKIFFTYSADDLPRLQAAMAGPKFGKQYKRGVGKHPPAIELHLGNRYFAVTELRLDGLPDTFRQIDTDDLIRLIRVKGPEFANKSPSEFEPNLAPPVYTDANQDLLTRINSRCAFNVRLRSRWAGNWTGLKDTSGSGKAFALAAALKSAGFNFDDTVAALMIHPQTVEWTQTKGHFNNQRELCRIWKRIDDTPGLNTPSATPEEDSKLILSPGSPLISAREFLRMSHTSSGLRTLHHQNATFYDWAGTHYCPTTSEEIKATLYGFLDKALRTTEKEGVTAPFSPTKSKVANVLEAVAAAAQLPASARPPSWLDDANLHPPADELIACRNGLLHLPNRILSPHSAAFFSLNALDFDYEKDAPEPVEWLRFLKQLWPADNHSIAMLQEMFGLMLTGDTSHQKAFLLVGPKRSGKGTIARVMTKMLGQPNVCGPTLGSLGGTFGLEPLIGKRLAIISDARLGGKTDQQVVVERILAITGEDSLSIDRKHIGAWTGRLEARILMLTNELPKIADASGALASRFLILLTTNSFYGKEDRGLTDRIVRELPGILNWALVGWESLKQRGYFIQPVSSAAAQRDLEDLGSPIGAFIRDRCVIAPGATCRTDELYNRWCDWCREQNMTHVGTVQTFGRDLRSVVSNLKVTQPRNAAGRQEQRCYEGIRLDSDTR